MVGCGLWEELCFVARSRLQAVLDGGAAEELQLALHLRREGLQRRVAALQSTKSRRKCAASVSKQHLTSDAATALAKGISFSRK